jgi:flagellar hook-associated protein FlgK
MDEEMANLILYQNAYSASARVITTLSEVMKTLTDMV